MKIKKIYIILIISLILSLVLPSNVNAIGIASSKVGKELIVKTGDTFTMPIYLAFSEIDARDMNSFGIGGLVTTIDFDEEVLKIIDISANGFNSLLSTKDGKQQIVSIISDEDLLNNSCQDGILYCGEYNASITFYVKDTNKENTEVNVINTNIIGWPIQNGKRATYLENDIKTYLNEIKKPQKITIKKDSIKEEPSTLIKTIDNGNINKEIINIVSKKLTQQVSSNNSDKSSNNYLSVLEVKGYAIDFYKRTNDYEIEVSNNVNSIDVTAELEDKTATLEIKGANNLKSNNNKVEIIVTAENGIKNIYTINVKKEDNIEHKNSLNDIKNIKKIKDIVIEYKQYLIIGISALILIIIISVIINKVNDNKLGNKFDNF